MSGQALNGVKKSLLCEVVEQLTTQKNACGRLLFAGCLLSSSFDAAAATYIVNTTGDPGPTGTTSFRQAVTAAAADPDNVIQFDSSLRDSTITLTQGAVRVAFTPQIETISIVGPGSRYLTLTGNGSSSRLITVLDDNITITGITLANGNGHDAPYNVGGGCMFAGLSNVFLVDVVIKGCRADGTGGGIDVADGNLTMFNSTITGNYSAHEGGGIFADNAFNSSNGIASKVSIYNSTISNNSAYSFGGGVLAQYTETFKVYGSLISGNTTNSIPTASAGGGGIALGSIYAQALIVNSTVANNSTYSYGGGISLLDTHTAQVTHVNFSTITGNYSGYNYGGNGIHGKDAFSVNSSIIANNFNRAGNVDVDGTLNADHSLIRNSGGARLLGSNNILGVDPHLGPLAFNGGATLTFLPQKGSLAIDAGGNPGTIHNDQRNLPRPVGAASDIGAVERQAIEDEIFRGDFESS
jgi:hypothetical protein